MLALHFILCALLGVSLAGAIVELGLSAYVTTFWGNTQKVPYWNLIQGYAYRGVDVGMPGILIFLIFSACWTVLISAAALVLPRLLTRKGHVSASLNAILGFGLAVAYFVTMAFWLAGFADLVSVLNGGMSTSDYVNAIIAFAVLLWYVLLTETLEGVLTVSWNDRVLFLLLFILAILALCGVLTSTWTGYQSMRKEKSASTSSPSPPQPSALAPVEPTRGPERDREVPMSANPAGPASELSTRQSEALHNQPTSQSHSVSSPSAVVSAELSGDSVHNHHASHA